jgi:C4-dicarboxylate transporter DctM subunit
MVGLRRPRRRGQDGQSQGRLVSVISINLPPVGCCLFTACFVSNASIEAATRSILPFIFAMLINLAFITVFRQVSLFFPRLLAW